MDYVALKAELQNDPQALGYAPFVANGSDQKLANLINALKQTATVTRNLVPAYEVWEAIVPADWAALTSQEKQRVETILAMGMVKVSGPNTRSAFLAAFGVGTPTRTNLAALQTKIGSRAEELFGEGVGVTNEDVAIALRRT
jgi:hypothetical protein